MGWQDYKAIATWMGWTSKILGGLERVARLVQWLQLMPQYRLLMGGRRELTHWSVLCPC